LICQQIFDMMILGVFNEEKDQTEKQAGQIAMDRVRRQAHI
jgi:hypothetical protein